MNPANASATPATDCWNRIGIGGDGSCEELPKVVHCRNCPVYAGAGRGLLDRETTADYRAEWTALLAKQQERRSSATQSLVVFQLGDELLALPTHSFREVVQPRPVHRLPARRSRILMGLVNVRGEIQLCISLASLLGLASRLDAAAAATQGRMMVVEQEKQVWVFPVEKVLGTFRIDPKEVQALPATLHHAQHSFTHGAIEWEGRSVGCLDEVSVFAAVRKGIA
ncbi:MAG: purine-binding chemotaxis protein CheW [Planctomycetota bacterium]|nr:purine-binding chemotaxis protein CheW [Planctomycetota bacterium]